MILHLPSIPTTRFIKIPFLLGSVSPDGPTCPVSSHNEHAMATSGFTKRITTSYPEAAVLEHHGMRRHVSSFYLLATFPPQTHDVYEFGILGKQLSECLHIMPIPVLA